MPSISEQQIDFAAISFMSVEVLDGMVSRPPEENVASDGPFGIGPIHQRSAGERKSMPPDPHECFVAFDHRLTVARPEEAVCDVGWPVLDRPSSAVFAVSGRRVVDDLSNPHQGVEIAIGALALG